MDIFHLVTNETPRRVMIVAAASHADARATAVAEQAPRKSHAAIWANPDATACTRIGAYAGQAKVSFVLCKGHPARFT